MRGGAWLFNEAADADVFTPEKRIEEQRLIISYRAIRWAQQPSRDGRAKMSASRSCSSGGTPSPRWTWRPACEQARSSFV